MKELALVDECHITPVHMPAREDGAQRLAIDIELVTRSSPHQVDPDWPVFRLTDQMALDLLDALATTLGRRVDLERSSWN